MGSAASEVKPVAARRWRSACLQTAAGLAAHLLAGNCAPSSRGLSMALPLAVLMVWWLVRLLPDRPLLQLAGAQLAVHVALGLTAACPADPHEPSLLMTYGHVLAIVALRFGAARMLNALDGLSRRSAALLRTVVDRWLSRPEPTCWVWLCASQRPTASPFVLSAEQAVAPGRGPPALRCP